MYSGDFSGIASDVMIMKRYILNRISPMAFAMDMQSGISNERRKLIDQQIDNSILGSSINFLLYEWMTNIDFQQLPNVPLDSLIPSNRFLLYVYHYDTHHNRKCQF